MDTLTTVLFLSWFAMLVYFGFVVQRPTYATWHMFAGGTHCLMDLWIAEGEEKRPFNPWEYLPHTQLSLSPSDFQNFLLYLRLIHHVHVSGSVTMMEGYERQILQVVDGYVVD